MKPEIDTVVERFQRIYLGDSEISSIELSPMSLRCVFFLSHAALLRPGADRSIFDPEERYEPARLHFIETRSISCPEGEFYLNNTIVFFEALRIADDDLVRFRLQMTGGDDNESFMRSLIVVARDFSLSHFVSQHTLP